jgi:predicted dehydrogenase
LTLNGNPVGVTALDGAEREIRVVVVGAGRIVERVHLPVISSFPNITITALLDVDQERATQLARRFEIKRVCTTLDELCETHPQIALVACPNYLHAQVATGLLESGIHVLVEKPMAISSSEAALMCDSAAHTTSELMVGFVNRFRPEVQSLKKNIEAGVLGDVKSIRCGWLRRNGIPGANTWFCRRAKAGGGALMDIGSHLIDLCVWFSGARAIKSASCILDVMADARAQASWYGADWAHEEGSSDVEVSAAGLVITDTGANFFVETNWASSAPHDHTYFQVYGTRGMAELRTLFGLNSIHPEERTGLWIWRGDNLEHFEKVFTGDPLELFRKQWDSFFHAIQTGNSSKSLLQENLLTVQIVEEMYKSALGWESQAATGAD